MFLLQFNICKQATRFIQVSLMLNVVLSSYIINFIEYNTQHITTSSFIN